MVTVPCIALQSAEQSPSKWHGSFYLQVKASGSISWHLARILEQACLLLEDLLFPLWQLAKRRTVYPKSSYEVCICEVHFPPGGVLHTST